MSLETRLSTKVLPDSDLIPIVSQVLDTAQIDSLDWEVQPVSGVGGSTAAGSIGLYRLVGTGMVAGRAEPWSVVVKVFKRPDSPSEPGDTSSTPAAWNYWKREILTYESGLVANLGGNLVTPQCYAITEHTNNEWRVWLESVEETVEIWPLNRHAIAAQHLGQFNGGYLRGRVLPAEEPWMFRGRSRGWSTRAEEHFRAFQQYAASSPGKRWLRHESVERVNKLIRAHHSLLAILDRLPVCLCHHDAFRRNLLARDAIDGTTQTVAIDWSMFGYGGIGEDAGIATANALMWLDVPHVLAREMEEITFESYVRGLRDVGWRGDVRFARFGYVTAASLAIGVGFVVVLGAIVLSSEEGAQWASGIIGHDLDTLYEQWAVVHPFLLDLGDEAISLMDEIG